MDPETFPKCKKRSFRHIELEIWWTQLQWSKQIFKRDFLQQKLTVAFLAIEMPVKEKSDKASILFKIVCIVWKLRKIIFLLIKTILLQGAFLSHFWNYFLIFQSLQLN